MPRYEFYCEDCKKPFAPAPGGRRLLRRDVEEKLKEPHTLSFNEEMRELQGHLGTTTFFAHSFSQVY